MFAFLGIGTLLILINYTGVVWNTSNWILLGGLGYAIDAWRGTSPWFLLGGLLLGLAVGFYELAKAFWHK